MRAASDALRGSPQLANLCDSRLTSVRSLPGHPGGRGLIPSLHPFTAWPSGAKEENLCSLFKKLSFSFLSGRVTLICKPYTVTFAGTKRSQKVPNRVVFGDDFGSYLALLFLQQEMQA